MNVFLGETKLSTDNIMKFFTSFRANITFCVPPKSGSTNLKKFLFILEEKAKDFSEFANVERSVVSKFIFYVLTICTGYFF